MDTSRIAVFTGHMIDRPGRTTPRFPASAEPAVAARIAATLEDHQVHAGFSQAADGGDLLFLEALLQRGAQPYVVLPFPREAFRSTSVSAEWAARYAAVLDHPTVTLDELAVVLPTDPTAQASAFQQCNTVLADRAVQRDPSALLVCVWDGTPGPTGGTGDFAATWRAAGRRVDVIRPL